MKIPDDARCAWCGTTHFLTRDHIVPRSEGGGGGDNIRFLCRPPGGRGCHDLRHLNEAMDEATLIRTAKILQLGEHRVSLVVVKSVPRVDGIRDPRLHLADESQALTDKPPIPCVVPGCLSATEANHSWCTAHRCSSAAILERLRASDARRRSREIAR